MPALRKGARSEGALELTIPRTAPDGTYALTACADATDRVRERDERNNCRSSVKTVLIDTTAPEAPRLDGHPAQASKDTSPTFAFSSVEAGVEFTCRVDDAPPAVAARARCASTGWPRARIASRFARATRPATRALQPCSTGSWTSRRRSRPSIDERPEPVTEGEQARVAFSAAEPGVEFACALDGAPSAPCSSPLELTGLESGDHTLRVVARDAAGNESEASSVEWTGDPRADAAGRRRVVVVRRPARGSLTGGRTYVGWVAQDGDIKLSVYDHATLQRTTALVAPRVEVDDHANPAVQILPDGRVRAYYSAHAGPRMWYRTSLAPEDISAWGPAQTVPENPAGSSGFTYPNPIHLAAEGRTYLFWRGGTRARPSRASPTDRTPGPRLAR